MKMYYDWTVAVKRGTMYTNVATSPGAETVRFEWDETKRAANVVKHKLDFVDVDLLFANLHLVGAAKTVDGETRLLAVGVIFKVYVTVIFIDRGDVRRIISMRKAREDEKRSYQRVFGG